MTQGPAEMQSQIEGLTSNVPLESGKDLDLLLVGKSGNGLSSTWKSITGQDDVEIRGGWTPVTPDCQVGNATIGGRHIRIVDTPGIIPDDEIRAGLIRNAIVKIRGEFPEGFDAIVLVVSYSSRFNDNFMDVMNVLKYLLGHQNWLQTHGIVLVTSGDNFTRDFRDCNLTFKDWCGMQKGFMGDFLKECNFRCVLFDNVSNEPEIIYRQRQNLFSIIDKMESEKKNRLVIREGGHWVMETFEIVSEYLHVIFSGGFIAVLAIIALFISCPFTFGKWMWKYSKSLIFFPRLTNYPFELGIWAWNRIKAFISFCRRKHNK